MWTVTKKLRLLRNLQRLGIIDDKGVCGLLAWGSPTDFDMLTTMIHH